MLCFEVRCRLAKGLMTGSIVCCAFVLGGCSADVARFNRSVFGATERSSSASSLPIPKEGVYSASSAPLAMETSSANGGAFAPAMPGAAVTGHADPVVPVVRSAAYTLGAPRELPARAPTSPIVKPVRTLVLSAGNKAARRPSTKSEKRVQVAVAPHTAAPGHDGLAPPAPAKPAHHQAAGEAHQPVATHFVPNIINRAPERVAALEPTETMTDAIAAQDEPKPAASAKEVEGASATAHALPASKFRWPVKGRVIAGFGTKSDGSHNDGVNIAVPLGTDVLAAESGVVAYAGSELQGYGELILIRHDNGWVTAYAHNEQILVNRDDRVRRGQVIARAGKTGAVEQPQVHFEIRQGSLPVDPLSHLE
jgi:murein DD-endopeptidase MepM/ murein hydrolase activator NlpD